MEEYGNEDDLSLVDSQDGLGSSPRSKHSSPREPVDDFEPDGSTQRRGPVANVGSFRAFILSAAIAEFVASFFLVYLGISSIYAANLVGDDALSTGSLLLVAIGYGFTYGCLVYCFSLNGGGYVPSIRQLNPALTLSLYLLGKVDGVKSAILIAAQFAGAILGTGIIFLCFNAHSLRVYELYDGTNFWQQLFMSIFVSFLFFFIIIITNFAVVQPVLQQGVSTDSSEQSPQTVHELNCLITSLIGVVCTAVGSPVSGCFMNPLFGLTVLSLSHWYNNVLVVILGPTIGSLLATLTAKLFTYRTRAPFLTGVRWGQGGLGGLGLGNRPPSQPMGQVGGERRQNPFSTIPIEEKQGSRF